MIAILLFFLLLACCCCCCFSDPTSRVFEATPNQQRSIVLIVSRLGLANRFRALVDWYQLAVLSRRDLIVSWEATLDCNATFPDLFKAGPDKLKILPFALPSGVTGLQVVADMATEFGLTVSILSEPRDPPHTADPREVNMFAPGHSSFVVSKSILMGDVDVLVTDYIGLTIFEGLSCQSYTFKHSEILRALVPNDNLMAVVGEVKNNYFSDRVMIGVHVRLHEEHQDWAVVPPFNYGDDQLTAVNFGVGATTDHFIDYLSRIATKMSTQVRFFVASNSPEAKRLILSHFPDSVIINGDYRRDSLEGVQFAFVEWLILSEAALVLNTYGSSFAVEASQVHQRPLAGIYAGRVLHTHNPYLPFCGHLLYLKTYAQQGQEEVYIEKQHGASFQRPVPGKHIWMQACDNLKEWGLDSFCVKADDEERD